MNNNETNKKIIYPSIVFKVKDGYYALNSKNVATIMQIPEYELLPDAPQNVVGIFKFRKGVIPIISVRRLFGMPTLREESAEFSAMLEARKQDHIKWVTELHRCIRDGIKFTMAKDPHKCAFGRWYDHFETDNHTIKFHLHKIETPHRLLHETAHEIDHLLNKPESSEQKQEVREAMTRVEEDYMPKILEILDDAKDLFDAAHHSMLIVISQEDYTFALAVDDVLSVEELAEIANEENVDKLQGSQYITEIKKSETLSRLILVMDDTRVSEIAKTYKLREHTPS